MHVLVVEDDGGTRRFLEKGLKEAGFAVDAVATGEDGLYMAIHTLYDLIILDVMLPGPDGYEVLAALRNRRIETPVLFLTAKDRKSDIVHGLELGADDYLVKPFSFAELLARIRAVARRGQATSPDQEIVIGDLVLDRLKREVHRAGKKIELTAKEFQLLEYMMRNPGYVLTRTMILEQVWGYNFDTQSNIIDVHINRLRAKVDKGFGKKMLRTIRGMGYVIETAA
ncbi:heavy metal response regulator transcription factor [Desulfosarcina ovata]|uniref:DNA-binding response regulator n=1 Tax=Desulfosarcina ovata subsp. ovata TaxID=2752305 RepID=A0A5K8AGG3_9BACT|nr:heavy metal response regulator transcription factor [Desulfosarcina ovata]BBO91711.1 DNA-binding response regulator [Desulfosarcina ovata subsp. ovata]